MGKQFLILFSLILGLGHNLPSAIPSTCPDPAPSASFHSVGALRRTVKGNVVI